MTTVIMGMDITVITMKTKLPHWADLAEQIKTSVEENDWSIKEVTNLIDELETFTVDF